MSNNAEYDQLVNQKNSTQAQYNACEDRIENYDYLLGRLRRAKESIEDIKDDFKENVRKVDKKEKKEKREWKGEKCDSCATKMQDVVDVNESYYDNSLDHVLDSINNEITRIENERSKEYGALGWLASQINSLANKIENFFN